MRDIVVYEKEGGASSPEDQSGDGDKMAFWQPLSNSIAHGSRQLRCYSVDRPIMRASHARDWGSNPHSSTPILIVLCSFDRPVFEVL